MIGLHINVRFLLKIIVRKVSLYYHEFSKWKSDISVNLTLIDLLKQNKTDFSLYAAAAAAAELHQSCPTLSDPVDHRLPGSSVRGIFQTRVLEWVAIALAPFCL